MSYIKPIFHVGKNARIVNLIGVVTKITRRTIEMSAGAANRIILYRDEVVPIGSRNNKARKKKS